MSVQMNLKAGLPATFNFNASRLDKVLNARTLGEAQRMGLWDSIKDRFNGRVKADAIRQLFESVSNPQPHESGPLDMLSRFQRLKGLAVQEDKPQFSVECQGGETQGLDNWSYSLRIGQTPIYESGALQEVAGQLSGDFRTLMVVDAAIDSAIQEALSGFAANEPRLQDPQDHLETCVQTMSDDPKARALIQEHLDDDLFSAANFQSLKDDANAQAFKAVFQKPGQAPVELTLSNRPPGAAEFRGEPLKQALRTADYQNLRELLLPRQLTTADARMHLAVGGAQRAFMSALAETSLDQTLEGAAPRDAIHEGIRQLGPRVSPHLQALYDTKLGSTQLLEILFPGKSEKFEQGLRFEAARQTTTPEFLQKNVTDQAAIAHGIVTGRSVDGFAVENSQDITDDKSVREFILARMDDDLFSKSNFKGIEPGNTSATFKAVFQREGEDPFELVLSDRQATNFECRGERVRQLLSTTDYGCLRDVMSDGYLGLQDSLVGATTNVLLGNLVPKLGLTDISELPEFLLSLHHQGPEALADQVFATLRGTFIGQVNLLQHVLGDRLPVSRMGSAPLYPEYA